ncbi:Crp/Fnr family transcriptional regulator [Microbispora sp. H13382]|uniref:Crp/Fnr family transcriptional regulator n=1 Tax=Microbispora sp. H13382 TaxID=2729112 RepID=UPI00160180EA|nr:Crp/Fnr family transcriptional regulator [Microbispora sp. H13382]
MTAPEDERVHGLAAIIPAQAWQRLADAGVPRVLAPGTVLMNQGDPADAVFVLLRGRVKVARVDADGARLVLSVRGPGEILGEMAVLSGDTRSATVTAVDSCYVRIITADAFVALVGTLKLHDHLLRHAFNRLREGEELRTELAALPAGQRVVRGLLRLALPALVRPGTARQVDVGLDQRELGLAIGLARGTVAQELRPLRAGGLISTVRGRIVILDVDGLRRLLDS